jgi:hypothetical protein
LIQGEWNEKDVSNEKNVGNDHYQNISKGMLMNYFNFNNCNNVIVSKTEQSKQFFKMTAIIFSMISCSAYGLNHNFLSNSAMSFYSKEDWSLAKTAQDKALNQNKDGVRLIWKNPKTGSHGIFLPTHTIHANGAVCRDMQIMQSANSLHESSTYRFCKFNNQWKIV